MKGIQAEAGVDAYIIEGEAKAGFKVFGLNIDARAIIAIAIAESSLGTQGVATAPGANMFGFGAFDNNTTNAQNFSDDKAVIKMTQETIIQNQNTSFAIQDQKAQLLSTGNLNVAARGGVYCTDASGSGKRRAAIMESIDKWIDAHGGISEISKELLNTSSVAMMAVPTSYSVSRANQAGNYVAGTYPWGQCTWHHLLPHLQCSRSSTIDLYSWGEVDNYSLKNKRFLACQNLRPFYLS